MNEIQLGKFLTLTELCTCSQTYKKYRDRIDPFPKNLNETIPELRRLCDTLLDPIIEHYGRDRFRLTYGFCSKDLKRYLERKDPETGQKNGRVAPAIDQHMACEVNKNGKYYCSRLGAACDFYITGEPSDRVVDWILDRKLPFDSLYFYGSDRPIHISYGLQHKRDVWTFTDRGQPTKRGIQAWVERARNIPRLP
jgi:hypothetical protein